MVALLRELGHDGFSVIGPDRGGLVAFRTALDHPDAVERLGMLDIIPTLDNSAALTGVAGVSAFHHHLYLLAQPTDLRSDWSAPTRTRSSATFSTPG